MVESAYDYTMALNIKDQETEKLAAEVAELTGDSKTGAVREALRQQRERLELQRGGKEKRRRDLRRFLETEIWPQIPEELRGKPPMTKAEKEEILGYGPGGV
jgi:antitoxin VapB